MTWEPETAIPLLSRTPDVLDVLLRDLSPDWVEHDVHADRDDEGDAQR